VTRDEDFFAVGRHPRLIADGMTMSSRV
jgi:hypothetical protein